MSASNRINANVNAATAMMIYMSAQNELALKAKENIMGIKANVALDNLSLYIVEDSYDNVALRNPRARTTFFYKLPPGAKEKNFRPKSLRGADKKIGDPKVFNGFLDRAKAHFGQNGKNQKILILWGHGGGLVMLDEVKNNGTERARASITEFAEVLEKQETLKFDIIAFDSCYMGVIEVMNQFREAASFALVSSTVVDADGYPYEKLIGGLKQRGRALKPKTAAALIATCYDKHYKLLFPDEERFLFVCNMKKIATCADALNAFGVELFKLLGPDENNDPVREAINEALIAAHADSAYVPVLIFRKKLANRLNLLPRQKRFRKLYAAMDKLAAEVRVAFKGQLSDEGFTPTSPLIWSPDSKGIFVRDQKAYNQLDSSNNGSAGWAKMWRKFHGIPPVMKVQTSSTDKFKLGLRKLALSGLM